MEIVHIQIELPGIWKQNKGKTGQIWFSKKLFTKMALLTSHQELKLEQFAITETNTNTWKTTLNPCPVLEELFQTGQTMGRVMAHKYCKNKNYME